MTTPDALLQQARARVDAVLARSEDELFSFVADYVSYTSINPDLDPSDEARMATTRCQEWLAGRLQESGCFTAVDYWEARAGAANVVARRAGTGSGRSLLFGGHSDVVPVTPEQDAAWSGHPWVMEQQGERLLARGIYDMKAGNVAFLFALMSLARAGIILEGDVQGCCVAVEESGDYPHGLGAVIARGGLPDLYVSPEPSAMLVMPAMVGEIYFHLTVQGQPAHIMDRAASIYPRGLPNRRGGHNAIDLMVRLLEAFAALERDWGRTKSHALLEPGCMTLNISQIHGGETFSALAEHCDVVGSVLLPPGIATAEVRAWLQEVIDGVAATESWLRDHPPRLDAPYFLPAKEPVDVPVDSEPVSALCWAVEQATGAPARLGCSEGTSDANYLHPNGPPTLQFGPRGGGAHGVDEYIWRQDLLPVARAYAYLALRWCGVTAIEG